MTLKEFKKKLKRVPYSATQPSGAVSASVWVTKKEALLWVENTLRDGQTPRVHFSEGTCWLGGCGGEVTK